MPFRQISVEKLSQSVVHQIESLILRGILHPGERLPAERDLAERLGVSRPSLREAIADLSQSGLLVTRPGAGVFVADIHGSGFSPALISLFSRHPEAIFDYLEFRRDLEGLAAERAARLASDTDLETISEVFRKMERAHAKRSGTDEAQLDAEFHMAIVEASHNVMLLHMMRAMFEMLREGVFYNRAIMFEQRTTRDALLAQHRAIHEAIQARDPAAARSAVEHHLSYVEASLKAHQEHERFEEFSRLRLEQEKART
ncbi:FadR/GntR family transcriptional regulator [Aliiroseovarius sp. PTFE2010]|uniref:FadR/GntR family transcriptional regulator n=1 Tax=Aliiroseovarius sp. PTFE2010 TaxID=3417190 RepID=UPI003CF5F9A8